MIRYLSKAWDIEPNLLREKILQQDLTLDQIQKNLNSMEVRGEENSETLEQKQQRLMAELEQVNKEIQKAKPALGDHYQDQYTGKIYVVSGYTGRYYLTDIDNGLFWPVVCGNLEDMDDQIKRNKDFRKIKVTYGGFPV